MENIVLAMFVLIAFALAGGVYLFFRRFRLHKRRSGKLVILGNLLVFAFLVSWLICGGEVYYRFIYDQTDSFGLTKTFQRWTERHVQVNETGFRDSVPVYAARISGKRRRITLLGDSFTAGHGIADVEDRFANRIRGSHPEWEVHAFAQNGWDSGHQIAALRSSRAGGYELDIVVLVYVLNDISDIVPEWNDVLDRIYASNEPGFLARNSYLFNTLHFRFRAARNPHITDYYGFVRRNYEGDVWIKQQRRLARLHREVENRNGLLLVVTFPFLHNLNSDDAYSPVYEKLEQFWTKRGVPYLDLRAALRSNTPRSLVINKYDAHPNKTAHGLAAEAIDAFLVTQMKRQSLRETAEFVRLLKTWIALSRRELAEIERMLKSRPSSLDLMELNNIVNKKSSLRDDFAKLRGLRHNDVRQVRQRLLTNIQPLELSLEQKIRELLKRFPKQRKKLAMNGKLGSPAPGGSGSRPR